VVVMTLVRGRLRWVRRSGTRPRRRRRHVCAPGRARGVGLSREGTGHSGNADHSSDGEAGGREPNPAASCSSVRDAHW